MFPNRRIAAQRCYIEHVNCYSMTLNIEKINQHWTVEEALAWADCINFKEAWAVKIFQNFNLIVLDVVGSRYTPRDSFAPLLPRKYTFRVGGSRLWHSRGETITNNSQCHSNGINYETWHNNFLLCTQALLYLAALFESIARKIGVSGGEEPSDMEKWEWRTENRNWSPCNE